MANLRLHISTVSEGREPLLPYLLDTFKEYEQSDAARAELLIFVAGQDESAESIDSRAEQWVKMLEEGKPEFALMVSSVEVYGKDEGELIDEQAHTWASTHRGQALARAEEALRQECDRRGIRLTILRTVPMFGNGMNGPGQEMFRQVKRSLWFAVRDADARRSVVTMLDVAKAAALTFRQGGVYNVCDGADHTMSELAGAMSVNIGENKRMPVVKERLARMLALVADKIPSLRWWAGSKVLKERTRTLTFSNQKLLQATGLTPFDTVAVLRREAPDYPYT